MTPNGNAQPSSFTDYVSRIDNPKAFAQQLLQQNPAAKQFISQLQNASNGMSPKQIAYQLAQQRGINPTQMNQIANKFGLH